LDIGPDLIKERRRQRAKRREHPERVAEGISDYRRWGSPVMLPPRPGEHGLPDDIEEAYGGDYESICGGLDDSQPVEQYDGTLGVSVAFVSDHQSPVGQIQWNDGLAARYANPGTLSGLRWCSGTLIANDLFLTAGHCFDQSADVPRINGTNTPIEPAEIATNMHVNFNFQVDPRGNPRNEVRFDIVELVEHRLDGRDYAIARLDGNPGATFGTARISVLDAVVGDMLCIIGHPAGQRKRIEAGPAFDLHNDQIGYDSIDTLGGNSGSGILQDSSGRLVGVHTNGGCAEAALGHNHGVRITFIRAASPLVRRLPWSEAMSLGGELASGPSAVLADNGRLVVFWRGSDDALWHRWQDPDFSWREPPMSLGGDLTSGPSATLAANGRLVAFWRGTDDALWHRWQDEDFAWRAPPMSLGGDLTGAPSALLAENGRLVAFWRGSDDALWHRWQDPDFSWREPPMWLSGQLASSPSAVRAANGRLVAFWRGTDGALWHRWQDEDFWWREPPMWLGGDLTGAPSALLAENGRLVAFWHGADDALWHRWQEVDFSWPELPLGLGGELASESAPSAVLAANGRPVVFWRGTDNALWHRWQDF
jgi:V8-like Glu-specific endopeptidase